MQNRNIAENIDYASEKQTRLEGSPWVQEAIVGNHVT